MKTVDKPMVTRNELKNGVSYRIRIWDPVLNKQESKTVRPPPELTGKKLDSWLQKEVDSFEQHVKYRTSYTSPSTTFGEFFLGEWFTEASKTNDAPGMYEYKKMYERHLENCLGPVPLDKIVPRTIECVYDELRAKGKSDDFVYRVHKLITQVLGEAKRRGIIDINVPRERMHAPRRSRRNALDDSKVLEPEQVMRLVECIENEPIEWRCMIYLLIITGVRRGEVAALTWDSIDFENHRIRIDKAARRMPHEGITIKDPKTFSSQRYVYLTPDLEDLLKLLKASYGRVQGDWYVFPGVDPNNPIHPDSITAHVGKFCKKYDMSFTPQNLRSTFVSTLISTLGIDPRTAQDIVGHSSIDVTLGIYARSKEESRIKAQMAFENYINQRRKEFESQSDGA